MLAEHIRPALDAEILKKPKEIVHNIHTKKVKRKADVAGKKAS
jgi:hypothetical protein